MNESSLLGKARALYKQLCETEWNANMTGVLIAILSILIMVWWRPWGAVGAIRNWGDWILYGLSFGHTKEPTAALFSSGSVIGIGFVGGSFLSACLGGQFAFRFPPYREVVKAIIAGILMGVGSALAGGCNVGGMYNALGNLAANGFSMWLGIVIGVILGLWLLYKEMEYITWGSSGAWTVEVPRFAQTLVGLGALAALIWGAYQYSGYDGDHDVDYAASLSGILLIAAGLGYSMHRGRWCMIQGFREPHMTGDCTLAKSVALSIFILAIGGAVVKFAVPYSNEGVPVLAPVNYVRGTFGWVGIVGGFLFGLGGMLAGGCGSGTLWRVGEGQIKLWIVVPFFGIANALMDKWFKGMEFEIGGAKLNDLMVQAKLGLIGYDVEEIREAIEDAETITITGIEKAGYLGKYIYMPDAMGYGWTLGLIALSMAVWYIIVTWNEDSNKLIVPM
ncbi:MAG: YeeE/YedE thiosulfate transporter family protein [Candidatus Electrothrix aestuarii]|nr:YeeE/YedE thiosulfate transporter family protein [Candidatus Electrothrix aestuarii]